jgi:hypothetical protein
LKRLCAVKTYPRVPVRRLFFSLKAVSKGSADRKHQLAQAAMGQAFVHGWHR